jgi:hypothetical protein
MPTPSSNPPVEAASPRSYSFSTCPDDVQYQQRPTWQSRDDDLDDVDNIGTRSSSNLSVDGALALTVDAPPAPEGPSDDTVMYDGRPSDDPSSRSSTMSPRPQTATTAVTSPMLSGPETEVKGREAEIGTQLSREPSNSTQRASESESIAREPSRRRGSPSQESEWIDFDAQEDELWSPSMGSDYSCMRVSQTVRPITIHRHSLTKEDHTFSSIFIPTPGQQVSWYTTVRTAGIRRPS